MCPSVLVQGSNNQDNLKRLLSLCERLVVLMHVLLWHEHVSLHGMFWHVLARCFGMVGPVVSGSRDELGRLLRGLLRLPL